MSLPAIARAGHRRLAGRRPLTGPDRLVGTGRAVRARPLATRRRLAAVGVLAALAAFGLAPSARAGTFRVSQCGAASDGAIMPRGLQNGLWRADGGWLAMDCGAPGGALRVDTDYHRLAHFQDVVGRFSLPAAMPATTMRAAWLDWTSMPQAPSVNPAYLHVQSGDALVADGPTGSGTSPGEARRVELPRGARDLRFQTWCSWAHGPGWCNWTGHLFELRAMTLELEERGEPGATVSGALLVPGERTGVEPLEVLASDGDSGVRRVVVTLGGTPVGALEPAGGCRDDRLPPCPQSLRGSVDVDTRAVADGAHRLRVEVTDAAGNARTLDPATVVVHNQPRRPNDPGSSGPPSGGAGTPSAPSAAPAPGASGRPFPPNPLAGRGHVRNGTHANERARLRAWFELGDARRRHVTVPPGVRVRIRGRVTDPRGRPIGRATLVALRREPGGPWRVVTGVRTRPNGRFTAFSRIGPSQRLRFAYYAYGDSARARRSPVLGVTVMPR